MKKFQAIFSSDCRNKRLNVIDERKRFNQPVKNDLTTYENLWKLAAGQGDDYTTVCLLDDNYFKNYYMMIAIDLSKKQALSADPKAMQQINFTGNLERGGQTTIYIIIEEAKKKKKKTMRVFGRNCNT